MISIEQWYEGQHCTSKVRLSIFVAPPHTEKCRELSTVDHLVCAPLKPEVGPHSWPARASFRGVGSDQELGYRDTIER